MLPALIADEKSGRVVLLALLIARALEARDTTYMFLAYNII